MWSMLCRILADKLDWALGLDFGRGLACHQTPTHFFFILHFYIARKMLQLYYARTEHLGIALHGYNALQTHISKMILCFKFFFKICSVIAVSKLQIAVVIKNDECTGQLCGFVYCMCKLQCGVPPEEGAYYSWRGYVYNSFNGLLCILEITVCLVFLRICDYKGTNLQGSVFLPTANPPFIIIQKVQ